MTYDAFVSYSHAADGLLAPRLQAGLQRFAKPWWKRRALRVFRDETGLSVNPHLWNSIAEALDESEWFVFLASKEAARSPWIEREITYWKEHKDPARILPVVTGGEWVWDDAAQDFDWGACTAVPAALAGVFVSEPRHLDLRWARVDDQLELRNGRFRGDVATLAAAIRGVHKDDLEGEDVRQHRRTLRWAWGAAVALALLTLLSTGTAFAAVRNADRAQRNEAAAVAAQGEADRQAALAVANADEADAQKTHAEQNAARAAENQTEAQAQQARAEANAAEAQQNADQAAANAAEAQHNADEAAANAAEAQHNADEAAANAAEAQDNADRASRATDEANANADRAQKLATDLGRSNADLAATNTNLERQTRVALSRQLAASSLSNIDTHYDRALLHAVAANGIFPTSEARDSLLRALLARPDVRLQFRPDVGEDIGAIVSPDGATIGTANSLGGGELWDAATGRLRFELPLENQTITGGAFGPDDQVAVLTSSEVVVVNTTDGTIRLRIPYPNDQRGDFAVVGNQVAFARDGRSVAVTAYAADGQASIDRWDLSSTPRLVESIPTGTSVQTLVLSPDGTTLAWDDWNLDTGVDGLFIRRLVDGRQFGPLELGGDTEDPYASAKTVVFSADGRTLESVAYVSSNSGQGSAIGFWDVETGTRTGGRSVSSGTVVAVSPDQRLVAVSDATGTVSFQDARTGEAMGSPTVVDPASYGYVFAFTPDDTGLVIVLPDGGVQVIDVTPQPRSLSGRTELTIGPNVFFATLSPEGRLIARVDDGGLSIVDVATGTVRRQVAAASVYDGHFSPRDDLFAFYGSDGLNVLDVRDGSLRQLPGIADEQIWATPVFSPDGRAVAVITFNGVLARATLRIWDLTGPVPSVRAVPTLNGMPQSIAFAPDGTVAVETTTDFGGYQIELFPPNAPGRSIQGRFGSGTLQFSPDGKTLAINQSNDVVLLSMPNGTPIGAPLTPHRGNGIITGLAFDVDQGLVVTGDSDGWIQLWDLSSANPIGPALSGHSGEVAALAFTSSGRLVSIGIEFSFDDGYSGEVIAWDLDTASLFRDACERANRDLTQAEWIQLVGDAIPYDPPCASFRRESTGSS